MNSLLHFIYISLFNPLSVSIIAHIQQDNNERMIYIMKTCTFAGHSVCRDIFIADLAEREIKRILEENDIIHFYCGGMGEFDKLCETTLHDMKHVFPDKQIFIDLVMPFSTKDMDYNPRYYNDNYSNVIIPGCLSQYDSEKENTYAQPLDG